MKRRRLLTGALGIAGLILGEPVALAAGDLGDRGSRRMTSVRVPGFRPSVNGLHFPNEFGHAPVLELPLPGGATVPFGDAANGLCGGMVYAVRDLYEAGVAPPRTRRVPGEGPVLRYLAERLVASWSLPFGPLTYLDLMHPAMPDGDLAHTHGRAWRMIEVEWPAIRAVLDKGVLCPLGLVKTKSRNPFRIGRNHQVLAWGYDLLGTRLSLRLYDPNHPNDDHVTLGLDISDPRRATRVHCSHDGPVWCFFRTAYQFTDPLPAFGAETKQKNGGARRLPSPGL